MPNKSAYEAGLHKIGWRRKKDEDAVGFEAYVYKGGHIKVYVSENSIRIGLSFRNSSELTQEAKDLLILKSKNHVSDNRRLALQG